MKTKLFTVLLLTATSLNAQTTIYSDDFSTPANWVVAHDATACSLDWQIGNISAAGSYPIADILSTTAANGWAMVDSDLYGDENGGSEIEDSWLTMANPVDLNGYPNVVVEFQTYYRRYNFERPYLVVGVGDGAGNVVWPELDPSTNITGMTNVFDLFPGMLDNATTDNPEIMQIDISGALVGLTPAELGDIYVRFNWTGTWGYAWFVDDFKITEQAPDDLRLQSALIVGNDNDGVYYGRTPVEQINASYTIGGDVLNFSANTQTNVVLTADFVSFNAISSTPSLSPSTSILLSSIESLMPTIGLYEGTYTVVSDEETSGPTFVDNTMYRNFKLTNDYYSQDGIGVHPATDLMTSSFGTNSFTAGGDGLVCATMYNILQSTDVSSFRVLLASGTVAGGEIYGSIKDTTTFWQGDMSSLFNASPATVTTTDITNGYIDLVFDPSPIILTPGAYYAAVEMYSNGGASPIRILDDITIDQPYYASAIYMPGDQSYSNGTSYGIRMNVEYCADFATSIVDQTKTCYGMSQGTAVAEAIGTSGPFTYEWNTGVLNDSISGLAAGSYSVLVTDGTGCSLTSNVTILNYPQIVAQTAITQETCGGLGDGAIAMNITGGVLPVSIEWGGGETTNTISGLTAGTYTYTITDGEGCFINGSEVVGIAPPDFSVATQASPTNGLTPLLVDFANQTPLIANYDFTWVFGDGGTEQNNASNVSHTYLTAGVWTVLLIAEEISTGCIDTLTMTDYITTGTSALNEMEYGGFTIYPNPTSGIVNIQFDNSIKGTIKVVDNLGQVVRIEALSNMLDLSNLEKGMYHLRIEDEHEIALSIERVVVN